MLMVCDHALPRVAVMKNLQGQKNATMPVGYAWSSTPKGNVIFLGSTGTKLCCNHRVVVFKVNT